MTSHELAGVCAAGPGVSCIGAGAAGPSWPGDRGDPAEEWVASDIAGGTFVL